MRSPRKMSTRSLRMSPVWAAGGMSKWTGPSAGAVHVYQTEPAGRPRRAVDSGSPGSGVAGSRSRATDPASPSIGAAARKWSFGGLPVKPDGFCHAPAPTDTDAACAFQALAVK